MPLDGCRTPGQPGPGAVTSCSSLDYSIPFNRRDRLAQHTSLQSLFTLNIEMVVPGVVPRENQVANVMETHLPDFWLPIPLPQGSWWQRLGQDVFALNRLLTLIAAGLASG
nr:hypothetical protein [Candidatus Chloroploca mongolica]